MWLFRRFLIEFLTLSPSVRGACVKSRVKEAGEEYGTGVKYGTEGGMERVEISRIVCFCSFRFYAALVRLRHYYLLEYM